MGDAELTPLAQPPISEAAAVRKSAAFFIRFEGPMFGALARRLFGSANDRYVKSLEPIVSAINELEPELEKMSDD